ncbi:hypothetical protein EUGRSUZ_E01475 [Eucalyptus grandis]|uniref:Uncharacterized protein n=2 Tax=Eucalyptus grandis TaxID=71139 RepID=A0ACC3KWL6_EUCGR|nr:hypothetical protein EUGRSUZ_E01475 [Eucalyptus grandis]
MVKMWDHLARNEVGSSAAHPCSFICFRLVFGWQQNLGARDCPSRHTFVGPKLFFISLIRHAQLYFCLNNSSETEMVPPPQLM